MIYAGQSKKFDTLTETVFATLQAKGHQVEKIKAERGIRVPSLFAYDLVFVGSPVEGFWGGKFSEELSDIIGRCTGLEGKKSVVYVYPKTFGTGKAMKRIMKHLEQKGSIVIDFRSIKSKSDARAFAERLGRKK